MKCPACGYVESHDPNCPAPESREPDPRDTKEGRAGGIVQTPRTDAEVIQSETDDRLAGEVVSADFARELEGSLSEGNALREAQVADLQHWLARAKEREVKSTDYAVSLQGALTELVEAFEAPPAPTPDDPGCRGNIHRYRDAMAAARALLAESTERSASAQPDREAGNTSTPGPATRDQGSADFQRTPHGSEGSASPLHHRPCREATEGEGRLSPNAVTAVPGLSPDRPPHIIKSPLPGVLRDVVVPEIIDNTGNGCHAVGHLDATDTAAILKGARAALVRYGAPDGEPYLEVLDLAVQRCHSQGLLQPDDPPNPDRAVRRYGIDYTD